jgi:hypothetical protein
MAFGYNALKAILSTLSIYLGKSNSSTFLVPFDCNDPANRMTNQQLEKIFAIWGWGLTYCSFLATHFFTGLLYFHVISNSISKFCLVKCLNDYLVFIAAVVVTPHEDYIQVYRSGMTSCNIYPSGINQTCTKQQILISRDFRKLLNHACIEHITLCLSAYLNWKLDFE